MALLLELLGRKVLLAGLKGVRVGEPASLFKALAGREELKGVVFQLLDARRVAGREHLIVSVLNAMRAMEMGLNVSNDLGIEILTSASGQRQISRAIELLGLKPDTVEVAVVFVSDREEGLYEALRAVASALGGEEDDSVLEVEDGKAEELIRAFGLGEAEIRACSRLGPRAEVVKALVVEKVALFMAYR
ncbi:MAG TPA: hypothetical protein ENF78_01355 [Candidatus Bathyarchaeota archaeon]|nr:hypothetical protein [Candidatus Bathyarchaeota archaeon]